MHKICVCRSIWVLQTSSKIQLKSNALKKRSLLRFNHGLTNVLRSFHPSSDINLHTPTPRPPPRVHYNQRKHRHLLLDFVCRPLLKFGLKFLTIGFDLLFLVYGLIAYGVLKSAYLSENQYLEQLVFDQQV
jgi:hypothetical protein